MHLMRAYDDRVFSATLSEEEQRHLDSLNEIFSGYWPADEKAALWKELEQETERVYRDRGL